ncbi:YjbF family lipoprotein [Thalassococcus sp. BH17M4-6]|uniref:YjbF family lipoprotein n=1 Tax=Thalassococcus sp. BH17M4-6 TaxID=3413148 RepID=UPI003BF4971A
MRRFAITATLVTALAALAACGNDTTSPQPFNVVRQLVQSTGLRPEEPVPAVSNQQVATAISSTNAPLMLFDLKSRDSQAIMLRIEQNGPYDTYATSTRQSTTLRGGMITATRGLGGDLMSSEPEALLELIRTGREGTVPYAMRFLNGEDIIETLNYTCSLRHEGTARIAGGVINTEGRQMAVVCTGNAKSFESIFVTDRSGYVIYARQWLGAFLGDATVQTLRK